MKRLLGYISLITLILFTTSCDDDSIQERKDREKADRLDYVKEHLNNIKAENSGLYFLKLKAGDGVKVELNKTLYIFYTFYHLDGRIIDSNNLNGDFVSKKLTASYQGLGQALYDAIYQENTADKTFLTKGGKIRLVLPSSLSTGISRIFNSSSLQSIETMYTREYVSVVCDIELNDVKEYNDHNRD